MLIVCPSCASEYALDPERIGESGRRVRCASCRESWLVTRPAATEAIEIPVASEARPPEPATEIVAMPAEPTRQDMTAPDPAAEASPPTLESHDHVIAPTRPRKVRRTEKRRTGRRAKPARAKSAAGVPSRWRRIVAAVACSLVLASIPALIFERAAVVRALPRTAIVFERIGLPVNLVGLAFAEMSSTMASGDAGAPVLVVEGRIDNVARRDVDVPQLELTVRGEKDEVLYRWSVAPAEARLAAGQATQFRARLASPPPAGKRVHVTFRTGVPHMKVALR